MVLADYRTVRIRAFISQIRDFEHPLRTIDEEHRNELQKAFMDENIGYQESAGMMSVTIQGADRATGVAFEDMFKSDS